MGFQCSNMLTALPSAFLDRLLSSALMEDAEIRLFVLEILISFIDRHGNRQKFATIRSVPGAPRRGWDPQTPQSRIWGGRSARLRVPAGLGAAGRVPIKSRASFWGGLMLPGARGVWGPLRAQGAVAQAWSGRLLPGGFAGAVISSRGFIDCIASPQIALLGGAALHLASLTLERNEAKSEEGD